MNNGKRKSGIVKWFNVERRFGFVTMTDGGEDAFLHAKRLHASCSETALAPGVAVTFYVIEGPKGLVADHVKVEHEADAESYASTEEGE